MNEPRTIEAKITEAFGYRRRPCVLCGGTIEKMITLAKVNDPAVEGWICPECLTAGADTVPESLTHQAEWLEAKAAALRALATCTWRLPSFGDWQRAHDDREAENTRELAVAFDEHVVDRTTGKFDDADLAW